MRPQPRHLSKVMPRSPKTWGQKMAAKPPHRVTLDKDFAGVPAGAKLLISSPQDMEALLRTPTQPGDTLPIPELRRRLALVHTADAACPVSTSIFLRTVSEAVWDDIESGAQASQVAPFRRVVEPGSALARKLRCGSDWIVHQRAAEIASEAENVASASPSGSASLLAARTPLNWLSAAHAATPAHGVDPRCHGR